MSRLIEHAIHNKRLVKINYFPGDRLVEPHTLGWSTDGKLLLRCYQRSGASASSEPQHWKLFRLERSGSVEVTEIEFVGPRQGYNRIDPVMKGGIIARL
jgi:WYL domain